MPVIYLLGIFAVVAYVVQGIVGFIQIKHFTTVYSQMKRRGRVAIGRKAGKFRAGTIVMLVIDSQGRIIDGCKMQGISVLAKFKPLTGVEGVMLEEVTPDLPCVAKENRLTQQTIMDAVSVYSRVMNGEVIEQKQAPAMALKEQLNLAKRLIMLKVRRGPGKAQTDGEMGE